MRYRQPVGAMLMAALLVAMGAVGWSMSRDSFDHTTHADLFSSCDNCHVVEPAGVTFPSPSLCQGCHNGEMVRRVEWEGPSRRANKFGFNHAEYLASAEERGEEVTCGECHMAPGGGPMDVRRAPASHTPFFLEEHRVAAATRTTDCQVCHNRDQRCAGCHSGSQNLDTPAREQAGYHPENFLQQHSASAWSRESECSSCHNPEAFCRSCHLELGRASRDGRTDTGFHNKDPNFALGHGQAARQGLESCASCHAQQDCLVCHSARQGRRINPHGPDFDGDKLRDKNPELCLFCHTTAILDRPLR